MESVILNLIALALALILAQAVLPVVNNLTGNEFHLFQRSFISYTLIILFVILAVGVFAGCYPALHLSAQNTLKLARQADSTTTRKTSVRTITVVLQYTVSIAMIICSIFLYKQLSYIRHNDQGYDRGNILLVPIKTENIYRRHELLKTEFLNISAIEYVSACYDYPGSGFTRNGYIPEGLLNYLAPRPLV